MHFKFGKLICWKAVHSEILSKSLAQNHRSFFDMVTFSNWIKQLGRWNIKLMQTYNRHSMKNAKTCIQFSTIELIQHSEGIYAFYLYIKSRICCEFYSIWHACMHIAMGNFLSEKSVAVGHCIICIFYHSMGILDFQMTRGQINAKKIHLKSVYHYNHCFYIDHIELPYQFRLKFQFDQASIVNTCSESVF